MFFVAMRYRAASLFSLFLHGKNRGTWEQKREETWFKILLKNFCNGNWKKVFRMSFREVVVLLAPRIIENGTSFKKAIPVKKRVRPLETGNRKFVPMHCENVCYWEINRCQNLKRFLLCIEEIMYLYQISRFSSCHLIHH